MLQPVCFQESLAFPLCNFVLQEFRWLPVVFQAQFKVLFIIFKVLYNLGSGYLKNHLALHISACALRSTREGLFQVPPIVEATLVGMQELVFSHGAPLAVEFASQGGLPGSVMMHL